MKLSTHVVSGIVTAFLVFLVFEPTNNMGLLIAGLIGMVNQVLIDSIGHETRMGKRGVIYRRNRWHSIPGIVLLSFITVVPTIFMDQSGFLHILFSSLSASFIHYVEDLVTEGGVFIGGSRKRIGGVPYDDPLVNIAVKVMFTLLFLFVMFVDVLNSFVIETDRLLVYTILLVIILFFDFR